MAARFSMLRHTVWLTSLPMPVTGNVAPTYAAQDLFAALEKGH